MFDKENYYEEKYNGYEDQGSNFVKTKKTKMKKKKIKKEENE